MSGSTWNDALIRGSSSSRSSNSSSSSSSSSSSNVTSDDENLDRPVVINGEVVGARTSFPFVARLDVFFITFSLGKCGGSLIATRWVLTAGHCLKAFGNLLPSLFVMVTLGDLQRFTPFESGEFKSPGFAKTNSDYYYDKVSNIRNDIGLVWLLFKAPTGDSISPIALPPTTWTTTVGSSVDLVGWGYYKNSPAVNSIISTGSNELRKGTLTVLDDSSCVGLGYTYISSQMICMGPTNNQSPCQGDSGGPVISYSNGIPYLVGVVSWGTDGCPTSSPSVATEVQNYLSWIKSTAGVS